MKVCVLLALICIAQSRPHHGPGKSDVKPERPDGQNFGSGSGSRRPQFGSGNDDVKPERLDGQNFGFGSGSGRPQFGSGWDDMKPERLDGQNFGLGSGRDLYGFESGSGFPHLGSGSGDEFFPKSRKPGCKKGRRHEDNSGSGDPMLGSGKDWDMDGSGEHDFNLGKNHKRRPQHLW